MTMRSEETRRTSSTAPAVRAAAIGNGGRTTDRLLRSSSVTAPAAKDVVGLQMVKMAMRSEKTRRSSRAASAVRSVAIGCVFLCLIKPELGNRYGPRASLKNLDDQILTHHLTSDYVAGYTGPLLSLFERTQQLTPLTTRGNALAAPCLGRSC